MNRYADTLRDQNGRPIAGASVSVYRQATEELAALEDDGGGDLANPVTTDADGNYYFNAATDLYILDYRFGGRQILRRETVPIGPVQETILKGNKGDPGGNVMSVGLFSDIPDLTIPVGTDRLKVSDTGAEYIYDASVDAAYVTAHPRVAAISDNGRGFRLDPQQRLTIQMFGGKADGTIDPYFGAVLGTYGATNNALALNAALAYIQLNTASLLTNLVNRAGPTIEFPAANGVYDFESTVELKSSVRLVGQGGGSGAGVGASLLRWRPGMHGIIIQELNTTGSGTVTPNSYTGGGTTLRELSIYQHNTGNDHLGQDFHGVWLRSRAKVESCTITEWSGNGIHLVASAGGGGAAEGNANVSVIRDCACFGNENGIYLDGQDANVATIEHNDCSFNRQFGIYDSSFLGNLHLGNHTQANGFPKSKHSGGRSSMCSYSGNQYYVKIGQAAGASTNAPSGTTADNTWWGYYQPGGAGTQVLAWVSGMTWKHGGAFAADSVNAHNLFLGCYSEGDQAPSQISNPSIIIGGQHGVPIYGAGIHLVNQLGDFELRSSVKPGAIIPGALKVGGSATASTPGSVTRKFPIYSETGTLLGFVPIYNAIS